MEEESPTRVIVEADTAIKEVAIPTTAPPQVAWEFVTAPGRRVSWQVGATGDEMVATGNRRGVGATNHCLHGAGASIEELLDWRPYAYFTFGITIPTSNGAIRMLETTEFEPTPDGTVIRLRFAAPKSAKELTLMRQMESFLDQTIQASSVLLTQQLEAELERRRLGGGEEPDLPTPRPDGPLAGISPAR